LPKLFESRHNRPSPLTKHILQASLIKSKLILSRENKHTLQQQQIAALLRLFFLLLQREQERTNIHRFVIERQQQQQKPRRRGLAGPSETPPLLQRAHPGQPQPTSLVANESPSKKKQRVLVKAVCAVLEKQPDTRPTSMQQALSATDSERLSFKTSCVRKKREKKEEKTRLFHSPRHARNKTQKAASRFHVWLVSALGWLAVCLCLSVCLSVLSSTSATFFSKSRLSKKLPSKETHSCRLPVSASNGSQKSLFVSHRLECF
jgi:hypothetical protein